jgi:hypothetical protein
MMDQALILVSVSDQFIVGSTSHDFAIFEHVNLILIAGVSPIAAPMLSKFDKDFYIAKFGITACDTVGTNMINGAVVKAAKQSCVLLPIPSASPRDFPYSYQTFCPFNTGTDRDAYVRENLAATNVSLSRDEIAYRDLVFTPDQIAGERYAPNDPGRRKS